MGDDQYRHQEPANITPLFRQQAVDRQSSRAYGEVVLTRPLNQKIMTVLCVCTALIIVGFFFFVETSKKEQARGILVPTAGISRVVAPQAGVILERLATEGQAVKQGDPIFVIGSDSSSPMTPATQRTVSELLSDRRTSLSEDLKYAFAQSEKKIHAKRQNSIALQSEVLAYTRQLDLQQQRVNLVAQAFGRFEAMQATNFISTAQLQDKKSELLEVQQKQEDLYRARSAALRSAAAEEAAAEDLAIQSRRESSEIHRKIAVVTQELAESEAKRQTRIVATQSGILTTVASEVGQSVSANQAIGYILPTNADLEAQVWVTSRSVGLLKPGMPVLLRYQSFAYQKYGQHKGQIVEIAKTTTKAEDSALVGIAGPTAPHNEPQFRVRIKLEKQAVRAHGETYSLKPGMAVDASIVLEKRRLYQRVTDPLFSLTGPV